VKLTEKVINRLVLPAGKSEIIYWDEDLGGFGLRIRQGGSRVWIYQFDIGRRTRKMTLGTLAALSPARARSAAQNLHAQVRLGADPAAAKSESRTQASVSDVMRTYLAHQRTHLKPRSYVEVERHLLTNCKALLSLPLAKVDRRAVATRISAIATNSGNVTANRTRASLSAFFAWSMREGLIDANPVIGTNRQLEKSRERVLSDAELKVIWDATADNSDYSTIVRVLMLTSQRADEIAALRWSEIVDDEIKLPATRTKNSRPHVVPIVPAVQAILNSRERREGDEFVFGRRQGRPFRGWGESKSALDQRIKDSDAKIEHWVHHDMRRTAATWLAESGTAPHFIEMILNHISGHKRGVAGIYNRASYELPKRIALQKWAEHVEAVVSGKLAAKVVKLHQ
jgi:integrase